MFYEPKTLDEALQLKARMGDDLTALAGGTDLIVAMNRGQWRPANVLNLTSIPNGSGVLRRNGTYEIAFGTTHSELTTLPIKVLAEAALSIGGPQIRNRGTLAGNLGTASPAGDGCVALLALDAAVELNHADRGTRRVNVRDYFLDYRRTELKADELITRMIVPANWTSAWYKIGKRGAVNISIVCAGVGRSPDGRYAVSFGSVGPYPLRAGGVEKLLTGQKLTPGLIDEAAAAALKEVQPISDHRASGNYRRAMCGVLLKRLLTEHFLGKD